MSGRPVIALVCLAPADGRELASYLDRRGYQARILDEAWMIDSLSVSAGADVVVLGDTFPANDALDLLRQRAGRDGPSFIMLSSRADLIDRVLALELGASDIVAFPVEWRELTARIGGIVARRGKGQRELLALENATVDLKSALVMHKSGSEEQLSPGQVALIRLFLANPRKVLSRDAIMAAAPAESADTFDRSIDSRIVRLRRKLDTDSIATIRGAGYRFDPPAPGKT